MEHRSRNFLKAKGSCHSSLERLYGQRLSGSGDRQPTRSNSLERQHKYRIDHSLEPNARGNSLERLHKYRTGSSAEQHEASGNSLQQRHRHRTGVSVEWQQTTGNSLERYLIEPMRTREHGIEGEQLLSIKDEKESQKKQKHQGSAEKRVEELQGKLEEERQTARRTIAKLQRDLARLKSERAHNQQDGHEMVVKELERERLLRMGTDQCLKDTRMESDSCKARLHALQDEFKKMEAMVWEMMQYKARIDQLKQEKTSLTVTYENSVQKCRTHISTLERENMMLLNQVKKLESQLRSKGDDRDKSRLLLERLKMVEAENSGLVLENEQQRQQYEKCLDQIANQVVQALLAQKTLREECMKLQNRVQDLEVQNKQLNLMFQQRILLPLDPTMQHMPFGTGSTYMYSAEAGQEEVTSGQLLQSSSLSLQSMFCEMICEDAPGHPQMSTPPPWLPDGLELSVDGEFSHSGSSISSPPSPGHAHQLSLAAATNRSHHSDSCSSVAVEVPGVTTKIETEFPATDSSPKVKYVNVYERGTRSLERKGRFCPILHAEGPSRGSTGSVRKDKITRSLDKQAVNQLSEQAWQKLEAQVKSQAFLKSQKSSVKSLSSVETIAQTAAQKHSANSAPKSATAERGFISQNSSSHSTSTNSLSQNVSPGLVQRMSPSAFRGSSTTQGGIVSANSECSSDLGKPSLSASLKCGEKQKGSPGASKTCVFSRSSETSSADESRIGPNTDNTQNAAEKLSITFGKVKLRRSGSDSSKDSSQSPKRQAMRSSMPSSVPFHSQYYYDYSDEDSDSRPVSSVYSGASTVSLNELLDTSVEGDFALDDDFFSDWSSMCLSPQHRLPILPTKSQLCQGQQTAATSTQEQSNLSLQADSQADGSNLHSGSLHQGVSPLVKGDVEQKVDGVTNAERDDSGCEVEPSHSEKSQLSQCSACQDVDGKPPQRDIAQPEEYSLPSTSSGFKNLNGCPHFDLHTELVPDSTAVVCTLSMTPKSVTKIQLPSPQSAVLLSDQSAWALSDSQLSQAPSQNPVINSAAVSSQKFPVLSLPPSSSNDLKKQNNTMLRDLNNPTADLAFLSNLIDSVDSNESFVCIPQDMSMKDENKPQTCRPDSLIGTQARKTLSANDLTSSSYSSSDESFMKPHSAQGTQGRSKQCSGSGASCLSESNGKPKKIPPPVPYKPVSCTVLSEATSMGSQEVPLSSVSSNRVDEEGRCDSYVSGNGGKFPPETRFIVGFMSADSSQLEHSHMVCDFVNAVVTDKTEQVKRNSNRTISSSTELTTLTANSTFYCKSLDSSFESLQAERSGSKDDGYSTMSSDIHPVSLEKYSNVDTAVKTANSSQGGTQGSLQK